MAWMSSHHGNRGYRQVWGFFLNDVTIWRKQSPRFDHSFVRHGREGYRISSAITRHWLTDLGGSVESTWTKVISGSSLFPLQIYLQSNCADLFLFLFLQYYRDESWSVSMKWEAFPKLAVSDHAISHQHKAVCPVRPGQLCKSIMLYNETRGSESFSHQHCNAEQSINTAVMQSEGSVSCLAHIHTYMHTHTYTYMHACIAPPTCLLHVLPVCRVYESLVSVR